MRTPEAKIKEAILHPEQEVRLTAIRYFTERSSPDESIMPLVIESLEMCDRDGAFTTLRRADNLPQTKETVEWLQGELGREIDLEDVDNDNYCCAAALVLCRTSPKLLIPEIVELRNFPDELQHGFLERFEMAEWTWDEGWEALIDLGEETMELGAFHRRHANRARRIVESLARHRDHADEILQLLHRNYRDKPRSLMEWLEPTIIEVAGEMRLQEGIPPLVERLHEEDWSVSDSVQSALQMIGGDDVVRGISGDWADASAEFRQGAAEVMGHIHTDLSAKTCLKFLDEEEDDDVRLFLADAILDNFRSDAIEPIRQMILGDSDDLSPDESDLRHHLVATATIMETSFPEYEEWYVYAVSNRWGWQDYERDRIRKNFGEDADDDEEDWDEEGWDEEDDVGYDPNMESSGLTPFQNDQERVGRNEPCPCGSGKKFKKCCMNKEPIEEETGPKFPIGTIAHYGFDDKTTTKIVASVVRKPGADPVLERWVGTNVKDSPKVRRQIEEFFKRHGVKSVVATDGNIGCPHEEGQDFPEGDDCPFCPWWQGKQGSARRD